MNREFSVRISEELARWVRRQGSPQQVIEILAVRAAQGRLQVGSPDPGPGPERLTVRFPASGLARLRNVTRSRENLTAFRKLILGGYQARSLPSVSQMPPETLPTNPTLVLGRSGGTCHPSHPSRPACKPSLAESLAQAGIYWPGEISQGEDVEGKRNQERLTRVVVYLVYAIAGLLFLALVSERREASKPAVRSQQPAGPQDRPWLPEMDSHLSKVVWGYE